MQFTPGWQALVLFLGTSGTILTTVYLLRANRGKIEADTVKLLTAAAADTARSRDAWVEKLERRIDRLEQKLNDARRQNDGIGKKLDDTRRELDEVRMTNQRYRRWAKLLVAQLVEAGHEPIPFEDVLP